MKGWMLFLGSLAFLIAKCQPLSLHLSRTIINLINNFHRTFYDAR